MQGNLYHYAGPPSGIPVPAHASARVTWLLAILAVLTFEFAVGDGERSGPLTGLVVVAEVALAALVHLGARRQFAAADAQASLTSTPALVTVALATFALAMELLWRSLTETMLPFELILLSLFRNIILTLAALSHLKAAQQPCIALSTFLAIFAAALSAQIWLQGFIVLFAVIGMWWLIGTYWDRLRGRLAPVSQQSLSRGWLAFLPILVLLPLALVGGVVTTTQTHALGGFMPSSGGNDWYSPHARSGVGDGDALVAGTENIQSFGPIEEAPFLTSHEPSLYDLFDDSYNEPVTPPKQDRAIALAREFGARQKEQHLPSSSQAGREFSTVRKLGKPRSAAVGERQSAALMYVKGRVPLHLKLETFTRFDGVTWHAEPPGTGQQPDLKIEVIESRPWLRVPVQRSAEIYGSPEAHALKVIHLDTNHVPSPTQLTGVHIDKLDRPDFFLWAQPGVLRMDRDALPALTVIHVQSRVVDERRIPRSSAIYSIGSDRYRDLGAGPETDQLRQLAAQWVDGIPTGWAQVIAVVNHLRTRYTFDPQARPPADCRHSTADFLFHSQRGPDYQFASAAVLALRSLGYSARLASGFYVRPERYETRSVHTAVLGEDVHVWAEVLVGGNDWVPLEPTPGYELLKPPLTYFEWLQSGTQATIRLLARHWLPLAVFMAVSTAMFVKRRTIVDVWQTSLWRWWPAKTERALVLRTLKLLDTRCQLANRPRVPSMTAGQWIRQLSGHLSIKIDPAERESLGRFLRTADWAQFAPADAPVAGVALGPSIVAQCEAAARIWSRRRLLRGSAPCQAAAWRPRHAATGTHNDSSNGRSC